MTSTTYEVSSLSIYGKYEGSGCDYEVIAIDPQLPDYKPLGHWPFISLLEVKSVTLRAKSIMTVFAHYGAETSHYVIALPGDVIHVTEGPAGSIDFRTNQGRYPTIIVERLQS